MSWRRVCLGHRAEGEKTMTYFQNNLLFKILLAVISENKYDFENFMLTLFLY